jgi:hypothetical protein
MACFHAPSPAARRCPARDQSVLLVEGTTTKFVTSIYSCWLAYLCIVHACCDIRSPHRVLVPSLQPSREGSYERSSFRECDRIAGFANQPACKAAKAFRRPPTVGTCSTRELPRALLGHTQGNVRHRAVDHVRCPTQSQVVLKKR